MRESRWPPPFTHGRAPETCLRGSPFFVLEFLSLRIHDRRWYAVISDDGRWCYDWCWAVIGDDSWWKAWRCLDLLSVWYFLQLRKAAVLWGFLHREWWTEKEWLRSWICLPDSVGGGQLAVWHWGRMMTNRPVFIGLNDDFWRIAKQCLPISFW